MSDDIEVIHMTALEWDQALTNSLRDIGLTWEQLTEQAKAGDFSSLQARKLWLMAAGQGPSEAPDPGNLSDRMSDAIDKAIISGDDYNPIKAAEAAMSVRDELVAHLSARAARAEAKVEHAEEGAQLASERLAKVRQELAEAKADAKWHCERAHRNHVRAVEYRQARDAAEAKLHELAKVKVWTNEDGKRFVFADDLANILLPATAAT